MGVQSTLGLSLLGFQMEGLLCSVSTHEPERGIYVGSGLNDQFAVLQVLVERALAVAARVRAGLPHNQWQAAYVASYEKTGVRDS